MQIELYYDQYSSQVDHLKEALKSNDKEEMKTNLQVSLGYSPSLPFPSPNPMLLFGGDWKYCPLFPQSLLHLISIENTHVIIYQ